MNICASNPCLRQAEKRYTQQVINKSVEQMNRESTSEFFTELCGNQLSSVEFVQDYLQLRFDGPCLNVYTPLTVRSGGKVVTSWGIGFRDLLCEQITKIITSVSFEEEKELNVLFKDGSGISVSLRPEDYSSPEAVYAHGFQNHQWLTI